jgi:hypothetical protein
MELMACAAVCDPFNGCDYLLVDVDAITWVGDLYRYVGFREHDENAV